MDLDSWKKKLKLMLKKKNPEEGEVIPKNWLEELKQRETTETLEDGTVKVIYEPKKTKRFLARRIKRFIVFILIAVNFIMLGTCFFTQEGVMAPFFGGNVAFLADYFWKTRPQPLEQYR